MFRKGQNISSQREALPDFEFENEKSNGTNIECIPSKINQEIRAGTRLNENISGPTLKYN